MNEIVELYSQNGKRLGFKDKRESHKKMMDEFFKTGKASIKHKHARAIILTSTGKLILQKRSKWKGDNPGLWDKTVGGHTFKHETLDFTVVRECAEELQIPSTVIERKGLKHLLRHINLKVMAVLFRLGVNKDDVSLRKLKNGKSWEEHSITTYYLGYYDGAIRFKTEEVSGFRISTIKEVREEMKSNPGMFTKDMFYILNRWKHVIKPITMLK